MILGVSHIILSSKAIEIDCIKLKALGYHPSFVEKDVPNPEAKHLFLHKFYPTHSLAYCQAEDGIPIELVHYTNSINPSESSFEVLFVTRPKDIACLTTDEGWGSVWQSAIPCKETSFSYISSALNTRLWFDNYTSHQRSGIQAILKPVDDLGQARIFWENGLNCKWIADGTTRDGQPWTKVAFRSPLKNWSLIVILSKRFNQSPLPMLDDTGFSCLALLTTNLMQDREKLKQFGTIASTGEFVLEINQKLLKIELFRGPNGELIELIEILTR